MPRGQGTIQFESAAQYAKLDEVKTIISNYYTDGA